MRDDRERLSDILEALERIDRHARRGRRTFERDELVQTWIVHHIEILGEAARGISHELRGRHPELPWGQMVAMRNVLAHDYFGIDIDRVWVTVQIDLPPLRAGIAAILKSLPET